MAGLNPKFVEALADSLGPGNVTTDPVELYVYATDASFRVALPGVVAKPGSTRDVVEVVNACQEWGVSLTPRGAATSFAGQALNLTGGLVLDMRRMDALLELDTKDRVVRAQPGINYGKLNAALRRHGYFFPPEPGSADMCTLGGMVANNASGLGSVKYGPTRQHVLDLEVVLASGEVVHTGSRCMKSASTYDLTQLVVGSEGTLGVITEVTLKVTPEPKFHETFLASFDSVVKAAECSVEIQRAGVIPAAMELVGGVTLGVIRDAFSHPFPDSVFTNEGGALLVEVSGASSEGVRAEGEVVERACRALAVDFRRADDEAERESIWEARHSMNSKLSRLRGSRAMTIPIMDICVPLGRIPETVEKILALTGREGMPPTCTYYGHIGDGNLHVNTMYDPAIPKTMEMCENFSRAVLDVVREVGGIISAEHGVGFVKAPYLGRFVDVLPAMRAIKRSLDPTNIMNPGQMGLDWEPFGGEPPGDQFTKTVQQFAAERLERAEGGREG
ncbi:MAG: FAD-binding oxidoreductase [Promethearchaeota archaeon]